MLHTARLLMVVLHCLLLRSIQCFQRLFGKLVRVHAALQLSSCAQR